MANRILSSMQPFTPIRCFEINTNAISYIQVSLSECMWHKNELYRWCGVCLQIFFDDNNCTMSRLAESSTHIVYTKGESNAGDKI